MKRKWKSILFMVIVATLAVIYIGSALYYETKYPESTFIEGMAIQNVAETLLFNPVLSLGDVAELMREHPELSQGMNRLYMLGFKLGVVIAPAAEVLYVFSFFDSFLNLVNRLITRHSNLLIIGYNDHVRSLLRNGSDNMKIFLWTEKLLSDEETRELAKMHVTAEVAESPLGIGKASEKRRKEFNRYLKKKRIRDVIIMKDTDTASIEYYLVLSGCDVCRHGSVHFFVNIENYEARRMLERYFDSKVNKKTGIPAMDLRIFNYSEIQAQVLFDKLPLHYGTDAEHGYAVNMLITGNNSVAESLVLHAMNQAVITANNRIQIDVYAEKIQTLERSLSDRFNGGYVDKDGRVFTISSDRADGELKIRLFEGNVNSDKTIELIRKNHEVRPYTYMACCLDKEDENLLCFTRLRSIFGNIPAALNMPYTHEMKACMSSSETADDIYLMGSQNEYVKLDDIISSDEEKQIREFNSIYNNLNSTSSSEDAKNADKAWFKMKYYQRESNRALYRHLPVKAYLYANDAAFKASVKKFWNDDISNESDSDLVYSEILICGDFKDLESFAMAEHRRFCYFYASQGWGYTSGSKDEPGRLHNCLCTWKELKRNRATLNMLAYDVSSTKQIANQ